MSSDYLIKETLDFAEKILLAAGESPNKRRSTGQPAIYRGMFFLSDQAVTAAIRLLNYSGEEPLDAFREFMLVIRREIGAVSIDENGVNRLLQAVKDIAKPEPHGTRKKSDI